MPVPCIPSTINAKPREINLIWLLVAVSSGVMKKPNKFTLKIEMGNAAFEDAGMEVSRILIDLAHKVGSNGLFGPDEFILMDGNGNKVGVVKAK